MEIIVGKYAGFCYGVNRAVEGLDKAICDENNRSNSNNSNNKSINNQVQCYGEIVHNNNVINYFKNKGVEFIDDLSKVDKRKKLVLRAHGVRKEDYNYLKNNGIEYKDFTCHNVLKVHNIVESNKDNLIILTGDKNHPENIGTISFGENIIVINDPSELNDINIMEKIVKSDKNKVVLVSQTTYSMEKFLIIEKLLKNILKNTDKDFITYKTICSSTKFRQLETEEIAKKVELMIIIGSNISSNTKKLKEIAEKYTKTIMIENIDDLEGIDLPNKIGITAGASAPKSIIDDIVKILKGDTKVRGNTK